MEEDTCMHMLNYLPTQYAQGFITIAAKAEQRAGAEDLVSVLCGLWALMFQICSSLDRLRVLACTVEPAWSRQTRFLLMETKLRCGLV